MTENANTITNILDTIRTALASLEMMIGIPDPQTIVPTGIKPILMPTTHQRRKQKRGPLAASESTRIYVYVAGSGGLARLAKEHGDCVFKIGTTSQPALETRLREIGKDRYGAAVQNGSEFEIERGFDAWVAQMIHTTRAPNNHAITVEPRSIAVDLPKTMTNRSFDQALHRALSSRSFQADPGIGLKPRMTIFSIGGKARLSQATEFYRFTPIQDGDFLLSAIETVPASTPAPDPNRMTVIRVGQGTGQPGIALYG